MRVSALFSLVLLSFLLNSANSYFQRCPKTNKLYNNPLFGIIPWYRSYNGHFIEDNFKRKYALKLAFVHFMHAPKKSALAKIYGKPLCPYYRRPLMYYKFGNCVCTVIRPWVQKIYYVFCKKCKCNYKKKGFYCFEKYRYRRVLLFCPCFRYTISYVYVYLPVCCNCLKINYIK